MIVEAEGLDGEGRPIRARWGLWAEANAGPHVPVAPAAALVRALLGGSCDRVGAVACVGLVDRDAILRELRDLPIETRIDMGFPGDPVLFRRLTGPAFDALPPCVRVVHQGGTFAGRVVAKSGRAIVVRPLQRLLGWAPSGTYDAIVDIVPDRGGELWTRRFGASIFRSRLIPTVRLGVFEERFGALAFSFDLRATSAGVSWHPIGARLFGVPLPAMFVPRVKACAEDDGGLYRFTVVVAYRWIGLLFAYRGSLRTGSREPTSPERLISTRVGGAD